MGQWEADLKHGDGEIIHEEGPRYIGFWEKDTLKYFKLEGEDDTCKIYDSSIT